MPRIPNSSHPTHSTTPGVVSRDPATTTTTVGVGGVSGAHTDHGFERSAELSPLEVYFAPYDSAAKAELALLDEVLAARKADPTDYPPGENPYQIQYAVYNLRSQGIIRRLIEASKSGVDVKVLIESKQIAPEAHWNKVDEMFEDAGLSVLRSDLDVPLAEREAAHLVGIESNHLMHLKSRIFRYKDPDSGEIRDAVLSGSMNPGDGANANDENLNLIQEHSVAALYRQKFDDVLKHIRTENVWDDQRGLNVLFTPCKSGPRPIEKMFEWIDAEQDFIMLSVFDLNNIKEPGTKKTLVEKLTAAKERGVEVVVITDRKKSDGLDAQGNRVMMYGHAAANDWTDEDLEKAGIPVYEFVNESGEFNAMHPKAAIFGLKEMKVLTGAGNWTRASMGSANKRGRNEESFIFVESGKLDDNRTGLRYLANCLYLLRNYDHQNTEHEAADSLIARLQARPDWPQVEVEPQALVPVELEGEAFLVGEHEALEGRGSEPGLRLSGRNTPLSTMIQPSLSLPFGTELTYDVVSRNADGSVEVEADDVSVVVVPSDHNPQMPHGTGD